MASRYFIIGSLISQNLWKHLCGCVHIGLLSKQFWITSWCLEKKRLFLILSLPVKNDYHLDNVIEGNIPTLIIKIKKNIQYKYSGTHSFGIFVSVCFFGRVSVFFLLCCIFCCDFISFISVLHCPAATQWKESAHASQGGQDFTVMRPVLTDSMVMAAWSHVCVWMEGCVTAPLANVGVPPDSQWVVHFGMIKLINQGYESFFSISV